MYIPQQRPLLDTRYPIVLRSGVKADIELQGEVFYAFLYCECIHETGYKIVSVHRTKAGAWHAKQAAQWEAEVQAQQECRFRGVLREEKTASWRRVSSDSGFRVAAIVINP